MGAFSSHGFVTHVMWSYEATVFLSLVAFFAWEFSVRGCLYRALRFPERGGLSGGYPSPLCNPGLIPLGPIKAVSGSGNRVPKEA